MIVCAAALSSWAQGQQQLEEGERALSERRYADAASIYEKLRQADPAAAEVHARLGLIYFQLGDFAQAVPALRQALKLNRALPRTDVLLAMSLNELGRHQEALVGLEAGFRQTADPALKRMSGLQLQRAYTGLQQDSKAVEIALQMSRLYPKDAEVLYHASRLFGNLAYVTMRRLSDVAPESVWTIQAIGEAQESQGAYDLAVMRYKQVIALAPRRPGIHYRLGRSLLLRAQQKSSEPEDPVEAVQAFERELTIDPTNANAAYELGVIHYRRGEHAKAQERFAAALKHYPEFQEAEVGIGRALLALNQTAEAVPHLRRAIELNPVDEVPHYQISRAYQKLSNAEESEKAMREFRRLREERSRREDALLRRAVTRQEVEPEATK